MAEGHSAMQEAAADCSESQQGLKLGDARSEEQAVELSSVFHPVDVTAIEFTAKLELNGTAHGSAATAAAVSAPAGEVSSPSTPAKPAAATAAAAAARAPSAAPVATQTPVERRQWLRAAQRSMRLSVTAFKDARSRAGSASSRGTGVATQLSNDLLTEQNIQGVELPATLKQVGWAA
jgi:pyruvate/2-oxoglutarate dehydrogenase complex dihydrolipoamide acyltransferase (E2) component